jgi:hypothetical protein
MFVVSLGEWLTPALGSAIAIMRAQQLDNQLQVALGLSVSKLCPSWYFSSATKPSECRLVLAGDDKNTNILCASKDGPSQKPGESWQHLVFEKLPPHLQVLWQQTKQTISEKRTASVLPKGRPVL